ncbi:hypothetical protein M798_12365 [Brucella melitensis ADMAS-G1]|nr:hypothetical protein M798_12365 [Brucella melitensis ADMAS-G1]
MDIFPANPARVALSRPVACDPMADALETPKPLDVEMDQASRLGIFVADDGFDRVDVFHPRQLCAPENAADGGGRNAGFHGDMLTGQALSAKMEYPFDNVLAHLTGAAGGARRAIRHRRPARYPEPFGPTRNNFQRDPIKACSLRLRQPAAENCDRHFFSTQWRQSGILVDVHSEQSWKTEVW